MATKVVLFENKVKIRFVKAIQYVFENSTEILLKFGFVETQTTNIMPLAVGSMDTIDFENRV
ncbi:MAG: hypothetical protein LBG58_09320 [Planctomycetaceae bacterium]|nr:hypothetical protein [Planctomycetaceae bacterium]